MFYNCFLFFPLGMTLTLVDLFLLKFRILHTPVSSSVIHYSVTSLVKEASQTELTAKYVQELLNMLERCNKLSIYIRMLYRRK